MSAALKQFARCSLASAKNMNKTLQVTWSDGFRAEFPHCWLLDASTRPSLVHLDVNTQPKAVECSSNVLRVMWPPFLTYSFSSEFLRENADQQIRDDAAGASEQNANDLLNSDLNKQLLWTTVSTKLPISDSLVSLEWGARAQEPGNIGCSLKPIPSVCVVDTLAGPANLTLVDSFRALSLLQETSPKEFQVLASSSLDYADGLFNARHPICTIKNGKIEKAVFNNALRSSVTTVECVHKLEALHKFGRICAELATPVTIKRGEHLIINNRRIMIGAPAQHGRRVLLRLMN